MATTPQQIDSWRQSPSEHQNLEFKEAKNQYDFGKLCEYCVALANEGGGNLLLGIADKPPRRVVGTQAFQNPVKTEQDIFSKLDFRVSVEAISHPEGRVLVFTIPSRPVGTAYALDGQYLMRVGEQLVPMTEDHLRRMFEEKGTDWNQHAHASALVIANLLGAWDENCDADLEIVRQFVEFSNLTYESWLASVREILQLPASPLTLKNGIWRVVDRKNLWLALGSRVYDAYLKTLRKCAVKVLSECDPKFDLPKADRYLAETRDKIKQHSSELRRGLTESLALLGVQHSVLKHCSLNLRQNAALLSVREIFEAADWVLWGSLDRLLPTLAEAAPAEFLEAVDSALRQEPCPFDELFLQEGPAIFGANHLTGLLWALETLAWEEACFFHVCVILGKLAERDPGGSWGNRPADSLARFLLPWLPQTLVPPAKRQSVLRTLQIEAPEAAWNLLLCLMPDETQVSHPTHKPAWRETIPENWNEGVTREQYWDQIVFYASLAVEMAEADVQKSIQLVDHLANLPRPSVERFLTHLASESVSVLPKEHRVGLWSKLTMFARKHREFADARWSMDEKRVSRIEDIARKLAPENPSRLHRMLFDKSQSLIFHYSMDWKENERRLTERRQVAIDEILSHGGLDDVLQFVEEVELPREVGQALGDIGEDSFDLRLLPRLLESGDRELSKFVEGYVWRRHCNLGWDWVDGIDRTHWSPSETGKILSLLPFTQEAWRRSEAWLGESEREYWISTGANPYHSDDDLSIAVRKLLEYGRPRAATECIYMQLRDKSALDADLIVSALLAAASSMSRSDPMDVHKISEIIKMLREDANSNPDDLVRVEWQYLTILDGQHGGFPKTLESKLATNAQFFCEVIRVLYPPKGEAKSTQEPSERERAAALNAYRLLNGWRVPPGTERDSEFSPDAFEEWLSQVKDMCAESGHLGVAQSQIGQVLIHSPCDPNGFWLHRAVANALNSEDAQRMREGYHMGLSNSRGAHFIDTTGKEDRDLAEKYRGKAEGVEDAGYYRLATTFRELADDYDREADRAIDRYGEHSEE